MEIGSFIELQFPRNKEYYSGDKYDNMDIVRLNSGRCAIYHACKALGCDTVWLPYYQCETVRNFLKRMSIAVKYYHINRSFDPIDIEQQDNECVVVVNYFGIMSTARMSTLASQYENVVIDNSQAFFAKPIGGCMNVYSARKFVGVPDGAYVIGNGAKNGAEAYKKGFSSDTALFLLSRIEYGCEGRTYALRTQNENRIDEEDVFTMSELTHRILDGTDYENIVCKRKENFGIIKATLDGINKLDTDIYFADDCVPMVYPLVVEDEQLLSFLLDNKHFQGRWWRYVLREVPKECFEHYLSKYMVPVTIDQRYGNAELSELCKMITSYTMGNV